MTTTAPALGPFQHPGDLRNQARRDRRLKGQEAAKDLLNELIDHGASRGSCFLSDASLTAKLGWHRATIRRAGELLLRLGYLTGIARGTYRGKATVYSLPLACQARGERVAPNATLSLFGTAEAEPERVAPTHEKGSRPCSRKGSAMARHQPHYGTHDLTHHDPGGVDGEGSRETGRGPEPIAPGPSGSVRGWIDHALAVAAGSGSGSGRTREAVSAASGAISGRLSSDSPAVIAKRLWGAIRGSEADRERLRSAANVADHNLRVGKAPSEVGKSFGAILKGTARPLYDPIPGSEHAEASRRPEPGTDRRRRRETGDDRGELSELARMLADRPAEVMGFAVGRAEAPPPARPGAPVPMSEAEIKRRMKNARFRVFANLQGGPTP